MNLKIMLILFALLCNTQQVYAGNNCFYALKYDAELQPISGYVALGSSNEQTFSMLANESYPTSDEKQVIYTWAIKREQCKKSTPPIVIPYGEMIMNEAYNSLQSLLIDLYKGTITYGQFARQRQEINKALDAKVHAYDQQQGQQNQMQPQYQQPQQNQPKPYVPPRTTQSRCSWQGNQWVCDTSPSGIDSSIYQQNR